MNEEARYLGTPAQDFPEVFHDAGFWFESFQNWQSEFFSIAVIVVFSIFLRQKGSAQSKPLQAENGNTGI